MKYKLNIVVESTDYEGMEEGLHDVAARLRMGLLSTFLDNNRMCDIGTSYLDSDRERTVKIFPEIDHSQKG